MNLISGIGLVVPIVWCLSFALGLMMVGGGGDDTSDKQLVFAAASSSFLTGCCLEILCYLIQKRSLLWMPKTSDLSSWRSAHGFLFVPAAYWSRLCFAAGLLVVVAYVLELV
jgi:hypothetical protein